jgi:hypothetical protein
MVDSMSPFKGRFNRVELIPDFHETVPKVKGPCRQTGYYRGLWSWKKPWQPPRKRSLVLNELKIYLTRRETGA